MNPASSESHSIDDVFQKKYTEFGSDLLKAYDELLPEISAAVSLSPQERIKQFKEKVLPQCSPKRDMKKCPGTVLPGVWLSEQMWESSSRQTKKAIQEYLTVLSFSVLIHQGTEGDVSGSPFTGSWAKKMMEDMKDKMKGIDFGKISEKIAELFGKEGFGGMPQLPEKFLKGQIARLAEEIVKDIKIEDFGLDPKDFESSSNDPSMAFQLMMEIFTKNPHKLQETMMKLTKKLQQKIQSGAIRPKELVAEAEELMKTFSDNPQFVSMMESFRQGFGFDDEDLAAATGKPGSGKLSIVKERLRKKLEQRKAAAAAAQAKGQEDAKNKKL
jgi:hypothetical protein